MLCSWADLQDRYFPFLTAHVTNEEWDEKIKKNRSSSDLVDYANASNVWRHQVPLGASAISSATRLIVLKPNSASKWIMPAKNTLKFKTRPAWCLWHVSGWRRILASKETRGLADREVGRGQLFPFCSNATLYFPILRALLSLIELSPLFSWMSLIGRAWSATDGLLYCALCCQPPKQPLGQVPACKHVQPATKQCKHFPPSPSGKNWRS